MKQLLKAAAIAGLLAMPVTVLAGGRPIPIVEIIDAPVRWPSGVAGDPAIVEGAIMRGCADKGWSAQLASPGLVHAVLRRPDYVAEIDIPFTATSFSIKYSASEHLDYNQDKHLIHRNFNRWLQLLRERIDLQMQAAH